MARTLPQQDLSSLIDDIVLTLPEHERQAFALSRDLILSRAFAGDDLTQLMQTPPGLFEFGQSELEVVKFIGVVLGTMKTAFELLKAYQTRRPAGADDERRQIGEWWRRELVSAGLDDKTASEISERFTARFQQILK